MEDDVLISFKRNLKRDPTAIQFLDCEFSNTNRPPIVKINTVFNKDEVDLRRNELSFIEVFCVIPRNLDSYKDFANLIRKRLPKQTNSQKPSMIRNGQIRTLLHESQEALIGVRCLSSLLAGDHGRIDSLWGNLVIKDDWNGFEGIVHQCLG